jgi:sulfite exporter TauE/SafE
MWKRLEPLGRKLLPVRSPGRALLLGMIWGWLPCGLVYSMLIWALSAGSLVEGALLMGAFGLGTLPNLLLMGAAAGWLGGWLRKPLVRQLAGSLVILLGLMMLFQLRLGPDIS